MNKAINPDDVASLLRGLKTSAGRLRNVYVEHVEGNRHCPATWMVSADPERRQRLDHYGTSYDDEGEEQEGWDEDSWYDDYAGPLEREVQAKLDETFGVKAVLAQVGEKGHVEVFENLSRKG